MAAMHEAAESDNHLRLTEECLSDIHERIGWSLALLEIDDDIEPIIEKFIQRGYIESCVAKYRARKLNMV